MAFFKKTKRSLGVEISDSVIRVIEIVVEKDEWRVTGANEIRLEPGIIINGQIQDPKSLARALRGALSGAKPQAVRNRSVHFALPDELVWLKTFRAELSANKGIKQVVDKEFREKSIFFEGKGDYSFRVTDTRQGPGYSQLSEVVIMAASRGDLDNWQALFSSCGLKVDYFDAYPLAVYRGFFEERQASPVGFLRLDEKKSQLALFSENGLSYLETWSIGLDLIASDFDGSYEPAHVFLEERGIRPGEKCEELTALALGIKKGLERASGRSVEGSSRDRGANLEVEELFICGDGALIPGLTDYLSALIPNISFSGQRARGFADDTGATFAAALGLALRNYDNSWEKSDPLIACDANSHSFEQKIQTGQRSLSSLLNFLKHLILYPILLVALVFGIWMVWGTVSDKFFSDQLEPGSESSMPLSGSKDQEETEAARSTESEETEPVVPTSLTEEEETTEKSGEEKKDETKNIQYLKVNSDIGQPLNVRKGPGRNFELIGEAPEGSEQVLLEEKGDWYRIEWAGQDNAWVNSAYVTKVDN